MERAEDFFFLLAMVERGALQLLEPLPGDVQLSSLQGATQRLQHVVHMLNTARDHAMRGSLHWHRAAFWQEILQLVTPANELIERRGDAFLNDDETMVHPSDCIGLSHGGEEAPARTRCESSAALLLCDAAEDFRRVMSTLVREQLQLAMHLMSALENRQHGSPGPAPPEKPPCSPLYQGASIMQV